MATSAKIRPSVIAGSWYPGTEQALARAVDDYLGNVDQEPVPIGPEETAAQVMARVTEAAVKVLSRQLDAILAGTAPRTPQDESLSTYFGGRTPEDGRIDWSRPAREIFNLVRAVTRPYPGAFTDLGDGRRLIVWWARPLPGESAGEPGEILKQDTI